MSAIDRRIAKIEGRLPQEVKDPTAAQIASAKTQAQIAALFKAEKFSQDNPWTTRVPYTTGDLYGEAQKIAAAAKLIKELSAPLATLDDRSIAAAKEAAAYMKNVITNVTAYASARGTLAGKTQTSLVTALDDYSKGIDLYMDTLIGLEEGGFGDFDPREVEYAREKYDQTKKSTFNNLVDRGEKTPGNAQRDMEDDLNEQEVIEFAEHLKDTKASTETYLRFFPSAGEDVDEVQAQIDTLSLGGGILATLSSKQRGIIEGTGSVGGEMHQRLVTDKMNEFEGRDIGEEARIRMIASMHGLMGDLPEEYLRAGGLVDKIEHLGGAVGTLDYDVLRLFKAKGMGDEEYVTDVLTRMFGNASLDEHERESMDTILAQRQAIVDFLRQPDLTTGLPGHIEMDQRLHANEGWQAWLADNNYNHAQGKEVQYQKLIQEEKDQALAYKLNKKKQRQVDQRARRGKSREGDTSLMESMTEAQERLIAAPPSAGALNPNPDPDPIPEDETPVVPGG